MLRRLWIKLLALFKKPNKILLSDILSTTDGRETLLGMLRLDPPKADQIIRDANRIIQYAQSNDYAVWANEVWSMTLESIDKLADAKLLQHEIDFIRGELSQNLKLLRLSYKAFEFKKEHEKSQYSSPQDVKWRNV